MEKPEYIYDLDDRPPLKHAFLYGLQWAVILFPTLIIAAKLGIRAVGGDLAGEVRFFQLTLLTSGLFTAIQSWRGHRYPLLEGPATAVLLTFIMLSGQGIEVIQGGTILGGVFLILLVVSGQLRKVIAFATPNVVGAILMLIAFSLLPYLARSMAGIDGAHPAGSPLSFLLTLLLVVLMAFLSHWLPGFWKSISILIGIAVGSAVFYAMDVPDLGDLRVAGWLSAPSDLVPGIPRFSWPVAVAFFCSYIAVIVNSLGSINGIANVTDRGRASQGVSRGLFLNGVAGVLCGLFGTVGMVSYSISPGVVLANRVASRYTTVYCGVIVMLAALVPKLAALFALIPAPVVAAALCVAMGVQVGAALGIVTEAGITRRDYFVVGLPVLIGSLVGFLPDAFLDLLPVAVRVFVSNGLVMGIAVVVLLEHVLLRGNGASAGPHPSAH